MIRHTAVLCLTLLLLRLSAQAAAPATTRGQFVTALWQSAGGVPFDANTPFSDVAPGDDCAPAVGWACGEGIVYGVGEGRFAPHRPITRQEAAVLLRRWAGRLGRSTFSRTGRRNAMSSRMPPLGRGMTSTGPVGWGCSPGPPRAAWTRTAPSPTPRRPS